MRPSNKHVTYLSASSDLPQPCSSKNPHMAITDMSTSTNFFLPIKITPPPLPKKQKPNIEAEKLGLFYDNAFPA
ncbi:hypothetical protein TNCV_4820741 [Trichonephila clavipes]|nr:hypothetical protein TNCV_4820741 [Trichonephila clavipes]